MSDTLVDGRRVRILCVIDDFSRECLATVVDNSISGERVARELDAIAEPRGYPCMAVSDNGTELTSKAMLAWQQGRGVEWHYIAPIARQAFACKRQEGANRCRRLRGVIQRAASGRVSQRASVPQLLACPRDHRGLED